MKILDFLKGAVPRQYEQEQFFVSAIAMLRELDRKNKLRRELIDPSIAHRYEGNFFGLLKHLRVPEWQKYFVLNINHLTDPVDFDGEQTEIKLIPDNALTALVSQWR